MTGAVLLPKGDRGLPGDKGEKVSVVILHAAVYDLSYCANILKPDFFYRVTVSCIKLVLKVILGHLDKEYVV